MFLNVNLLFSMFKKIKLTAYHKYFSRWVQDQRQANIEMSETSPGYFRLASFLSMKLRSTLDSAFQPCRQQSAAQALIGERDAYARQLKERDLEISTLTHKITKHLMDLEQFQEKNQHDRDLLLQELNIAQTSSQKHAKAHKTLEQDLARLQDKLRESEDEKRMSSLQIAQLQGNLAKAQQLYSQSMNEKSKVQGTELEYKKQLISLTSTIDSMAEEKEELFERISISENENRGLKRKLND